MIYMKKLFVIFMYLSVNLFSQGTSYFTYDDLWGLKRIGGIELSPDGKTIAFTQSVYSMDLNKGNSDIYLVDINAKNLRPFKNSPKSEANPKFSPDGKKIAFTREGQIWLANIDGSNEEKLTDIYSGASGIVWSKDGKKIAFTSSVYPDCGDMDCNKFRDEKKEKDPVKASIFTELMYRHWNDWRGEKRSHLFLLELDEKKVTDLTPGSVFDVPPIALGSANDYTFSPESDEIAFTMNPDKNLAVSTNNEIYICSIEDLKKGDRRLYTKISSGLGNDNQPVYSPDGKYIAFVSMERPRFEADKLRIMLYDRKTGNIKSLSDGFDFSASEIIWSPDSKKIYFTAANKVNQSVFSLDIANANLSEVVPHCVNSGIILTPDSKTLLFLRQCATFPNEIFSAGLDGKNIVQITNVNKELLSRFSLNQIETFWSKGEDGTPVQSILLKPPFFDPSAKYPLMLLIHGGPQGGWTDQFHFRWNYQMFANAGYVVVAPNIRGSVGYGQKFTDEISGDWGGKAYTDLMNAVDYAIQNFSFIDEKNQFAAGASYGGYMINWLAGHTDRFNALVSHAGVFNLESMYGTTEELWFTEWENKGTPWENRALYEKFSPHRFIHNCKTPVLVVHGAYDFRVPEGQAFELFTSLQRLGVESKFLYFPDETHFVSKPQNSRLWWKTVFDWLGVHYKN